MTPPGRTPDRASRHCRSAAPMSAAFPAPRRRRANPRAPSLPSSRFTILRAQSFKRPIRTRRESWLNVRRPYGEKRHRRGVRRARRPNPRAGKRGSAPRPSRPLESVAPRLYANRQPRERSREKLRSRRGRRALPRLRASRLRRRNRARRSISTGPSANRSKPVSFPASWRLRPTIAVSSTRLPSACGRSTSPRR